MGTRDEAGPGAAGVLSWRLGNLEGGPPNLSVRRPLSPRGIEGGLCLSRVAGIAGASR